MRMKLSSARKAATVDLSHSKNLVSAQNAGAAVDLSPFTIRRLGYAGKIKEYRAGKAVRYSLVGIVAWMAAQGEEAAK
jgi:hypothetical protein